LVDNPGAGHRSLVYKGQERHTGHILSLSPARKHTGHPRAEDAPGHGAQKDGANNE